MAYVAGFYGNISNYHNFGGLKFVPEIEPQVFKTILYSHPLAKDTYHWFKDKLDLLYPQVETEIFAYDKPYLQINFPNEGGVTAYFGRDLTEEELNLSNEFLASIDKDVLNTRCFKE